MNLNRFDTTNMHTQKYGATLRVHKKGQFIISATAVEGCGFEKGDKVALAQDNDNPSDWYIIKDDANGFPLCAGKSEKNLRFNSVALAAEMLSCFSIEDNGYTFHISTEVKSVDKQILFLISVPEAD